MGSRGTCDPPPPWEVHCVLWEVEALPWEVHRVLWGVDALPWEVHRVLWEVGAPPWEQSYDRRSRCFARISPPCYNADIVDLLKEEYLNGYSSRD